MRADKYANRFSEILLDTMTSKEAQFMKMDDSTVQTFRFPDEKGGWFATIDTATQRKTVRQVKADGSYWTAEQDASGRIRVNNITPEEFGRKRVMW
nr:MAG TPA: hypothetical protein [Caudoviricetes sp.]